MRGGKPSLLATDVLSSQHTGEERALTSCAEALLKKFPSSLSLQASASLVPGIGANAMLKP